MAHIYGSEYRIPLPGEPRIISSNSDEYRNCDFNKYDTIIYSPETNTYQSVNQMRRIRELESQLEDKKKEREKSLESIISYFYKRK